MGPVYRRGKKLWLRFKGLDGKWTQSKTDFVVGQERQAREALRKLEHRIAANHELGEPEKGPVTVARYAERWLEGRRGLLEDWKTDEGRLRIHVLPRIGNMPLEDVRPRHLIELFAKLRLDGSLAPKTIHNVYGVVRAMFRDALLAELVSTSPCVLTKHQLGENVDKDPTWRMTALYTRDELEMLISDPRIPADRQVLYALEGIGALRHGEAAGLRWKHYDATTPVLGRLIIATSYNKGRTKTSRTRYMPVHPTLAAMLAEWKRGGWAEMMGREPTPDDLVVPMPAPTHRGGPRVEKGRIRSPHNSRDRLEKDLAVLGLRHRRGHDLRRTMISLARTDGARKDILELARAGRPSTSTPRSRGRPSAPRWRSSGSSAPSGSSPPRCPKRQTPRPSPRKSRGWPRRLLHPLLHRAGILNLFRHLLSVPDGIRTRVTGLKGQRPGPLDDGDLWVLRAAEWMSRGGIEPPTLGLKGRCSTS